MMSHYNLRSRNTSVVDNDVLEVATILYNLRSGNYSKVTPAPKYSMSEEKMVNHDDEDWIDEKTDEEIIREACSCISRRLDPPERFFELLRMYDGGELAQDFVTWMDSIPPIRRCMENKSYRRSNASKQRKNREKVEESKSLHPLERTEQRIGFSTNLVNTPPLSFSKNGLRQRKFHNYNLRSLNVVTNTHRYNTRSTTSGTRNDS